jgi:hypothetical protein
MNYADGMLFGSIPAYPIAAIAGAFVAGSRWSLPLWAPAGLVVGVAVVLASRFPHAVNIAGVCGTFKGVFWVADALSRL